MSKRFQNLIVYRKEFDLAMNIFEVTKSFPKEETYSLTDQIRRSSRSVCVNIAEAYRKKNYPKHFFSKLTDADAENSETQSWLEFSLACKYISNDLFENYSKQTEEIGKLIHMLFHIEKFGVVPKTDY